MEMKIVIITMFLNCAYAPVPRCSPFFIINKWMEWNSWSSDMNPYFPVPPCEYGGPAQAVLAGDYKSVFIMDSPDIIPRHNLHELIWYMKTGYSRLRRMMNKKEPFEFDFNIMREGFSDHYTPKIRTKQFGHGTYRRPEVLDNREIYLNFAGEKLKEYYKHGTDKVGTNFNTEGLLLSPEDQHIDPDLLNSKDTPTSDSSDQTNF